MFQGIRGTTVMATQTVREINAMVDTCVAVLVAAFVAVAGGMITTIMIALDLVTGTGTLLRIRNAAARVARADMKNNETCGHAAHPIILCTTKTWVIRHLPAHMTRTSLDGISGRPQLHLPYPRLSKTRRH